jgi:Putative auto-transporter adhesin, head GIN domain
MIRKLLTVAASALALAIVALGTAWLTGGRDIVRAIEKDGGIVVDLDDDHDSGRWQKRTLPFDARLPLVIEAPVKLDYVRGPANKLVVSGPASLVNSLSWEGGKLSLAKGSYNAQGGLRITVTATTLPSLEVAGPGDIELNDLQQPELTVKVAGAASIEGSGKVDRLNLDTSGAGSVDFANLKATDARVSIAGVGNAEVDVSGTLDATIAGAGNVSLKRKPARLNSSIAGIGSIDEDF